MIQKLRYILLILAALIGGESWAQPQVDGYNRVTTSSNTCSQELTKNFTLEDHSIVLTQSVSINNENPKVVFTLGNNIKEWVNAFGNKGWQLYISNGRRENNITWNVSPSYYYIYMKSFSIHMDASSEGTVTLTPSYGNPVSGEVSTGEATIQMDNLNLDNSGSIVMSISGRTTSPYYYIQSLSYTYTLSCYTLITTAIDEAIPYANGKSPSVADNLVGYLTTAIQNANTFKDACAFPNSYWNGSSVGKRPGDVTEEAAKLKAIADYLVVRTNASVYQVEDIPNEIYRQLHQYDEYDPNGFDSGKINTAKADIDKAITLAANTTEAYKSVKSKIATAAARTDHNDDAALKADVTKATNELEAATTVDAINAALANIKEFDAFTFNPDVPSKIEEGNTLDNPASAQPSNVITYSSSDNTIIEIDGTTLKALKPGTVTITATTTTGDKYYGYTTTKEFTVTPKAVILYPDKECTIVPNIVYPEITLERSFSAKTHYTLTLPFDSNISDIGGDYAAQLALVTYNKADGYTLYFQKVAEGNMMANQPYIVYAENGFKGSLKWVNITVAETIEAKEVNNDRTQGWTMQGNYTPGLSMSGNYGIAEGLFRKGGIDSKINAYTAYFTFHGTQNVRARVAVMDEGGNTTYIGELKDGVLQTEEGIYGLDGVQQNQLRKGINIVRQKDGSVRKIVK